MAAFIIGAAIAAGVAGTVAASVAAGTLVLGFSLTAFATAAALGAIQAITAKKPQSAAAQPFAAAGRNVSIRQPISPWEVVIGRTRKGGPLTAYWESSDRKYVHFVITLACHRSDAIEQIWFDDEIVPIDANGLAFGKWSKVITDQGVSNQLGTIPGSPYQVTVSGFGALHNAAISGVIANMTDVSPNAPAARGEFSRSGSTFTFHSSAAGLTYSINFYPQSTTQSYVRIKKSLGDEGTSTQPFPDFVAESSGYWTQAHKQYGHTKIYVRLEAAPSVFPNGIPNVTVVMRGASLFDPRTDTSAYSDNAALGVNHLLTNTDYGFGAVYADEINDAALVAASNDSDDAVTRALGGTERRYTVGGSFSLAQTPREVIGRMLGACAGTLVNVGDQWYINVGVYHAPTVTLTESHLAGPTTVNAFLPARESCNGVKGVYVEPSKNWQPTDFPAVQSSSALEDDGDEAQWKDVDYTMWVTSSGQAQRLAKIDLLRTRQSLSEESLFKVKAFEVIPGRTVARTDSDMGWTAKAFEVLDSEFQIVQGDTRNGPVMAVKLQLRESAAAVYDWTTDEDGEADLAPNTSLPDPGVVPVPGAPSVTEELYVTTGSAGVKSRGTVTWVVSTYPFGAAYQLEYKLTSASTYTLLPVIRTAAGATGTVSQLIDDLPAGRYDFRVKALGIGGAQSAYSEMTNREIFGLLAAPSNPANFAVQAYSGQAKFTWDKPTGNTDLDVIIGGRAFVRWSPRTSGATWNDGSLVNPDGYPGDTTIGFGPLMTGTYMMKFRDSSGNYSVTEASFVVTEALITGMSTLVTVTEHPAFSGTKTNVAVADGTNLQLVGATLWDDMLTSIDSWDQVDYLGGIVTSGSYAFASKMDLGSVKSVRLFSTIRSTGFDTGDLWDSRTNNIDDWGLVDGGPVEDAEVKLMVRITNDDPASGGASWGSWHALGLVADYNTRGFDFRLDFTSANVTHNRYVDQLSVVAKQ